MTPTEANFDGAEGIRVHNHNLPENAILKLRRGGNPPSNCLSGDFKQQLLWFTPDGQQPELLWCDPDDNWYELDFIPIEKP
jgi:hypothetical protein